MYYHLLQSHDELIYTLFTTTFETHVLHSIAGANFVELWRALGPFATSVARAYPGQG